MGTAFLPFSRASFSLDLIVVVLAVFVPLLTVSIAAVRYRRAYAFHKRMQIGLGIGLGIAILVFEFDIRINGWRHLAEASPYYETWVFPSLVIHLVLALPALVLWFLTIFFALRKFPQPIGPGAYSRSHKRLARWAAFAMYGTAVTGWVFYWLAFVS